MVRGYAYDEGIGYVTLTLRVHKEEGGGGGRFANNEDPDDHSPRVESQCEKAKTIPTASGVGYEPATLARLPGQLGQAHPAGARSDRRSHRAGALDGPVVLVLPVLLAAGIQATGYSGLVVVAAFAVVHIFSRHRTADGVMSGVG
jgi:hypothetical protein